MKLTRCRDCALWHNKPGPAQRTVDGERVGLCGLGGRPETPTEIKNGMVKYYPETVESHGCSGPNR